MKVSDFVNLEKIRKLTGIDIQDVEIILQKKVYNCARPIGFENCVTIRKGDIWEEKVCGLIKLTGIKIDEDFWKTVLNKVGDKGIKLIIAHELIEYAFEKKGLLENSPELIHKSHDLAIKYQCEIAEIPLNECVKIYKELEKIGKEVKCI